MTGQEGEGSNSSFRNLVKQYVKKFWDEQRAEIFNAPDIRRQHPLPLACIKRIMKSNEQVKMISADTPVVFAKAGELFIKELILRAWIHSQDNKRRTLQRCDILKAITDEDLFTFLDDFFPMQMHQEEPLALANHPGVNVPLPASDATLTCNPAYPVNLQISNPSALFTINQEMQDGFIFPLSLPTQSANEANPHFDFK